MKRSGLRPKGFTRHAVLTRECDALMRSVVLERDEWRCRNCSAGIPAVLQVCHIMPKGHYRSMRHDLRNVVLLCRPCHMHQHAIGHEKQMEFFARIIGIDRLAILQEIARMKRKTDMVAVKLWLSQLVRGAVCLQI